MKPETKKPDQMYKLLYAIQLLTFSYGQIGYAETEASPYIVI